MGTDYPFDMGEYDPIGHVSALDLDDRTFSAVCGGNAALALGINAA
jgi:aminocarboxymuconate-semialdehyde decarboxylase